MSNETKFTPGPWTIGNENNQCCDINIGETVCSLDRYEHLGSKFAIERDEMLANASLIAAAPDMYALLKSLDDVWTEYWPDGHDVLANADRVVELSEETAEIWKQIRAALAKVRGEA